MNFDLSCPDFISDIPAWLSTESTKQFVLLYVAKHEQIQHLKPVAKLIYICLYISNWFQYKV